MTTRLLHVSDTHLGNRQYGSDIRREDFADAFQQAIDYAIDQEVDAIIHTGDLFDSRDPRLPDLNRCIDILQSLDAADIPFYGIVGNHERKMDDQYLDLIRKTGTAERLDKSPRIINDEVALYGIDAVTKPAWHGEDFTLEEVEELLTAVVPTDATEEGGTEDRSAGFLGNWRERGLCRTGSDGARARSMVTRFDNIRIRSLSECSTVTA